MNIKICSVEGCLKSVYALGYCCSHRAKFKRHGDPLFQHKDRHGLGGTPLHTIWRGMVGRCYLTTSKAYKNYGGRGIDICKEWKNDFRIFNKWALDNGYELGLTIERKNNDKGYCPINCCWIPRKEQNLNKRNSFKITYKNETNNLMEWSRKTGLSSRAIKYRIENGWPIENVLTNKAWIKPSK